MDICQSVLASFFVRAAAGQYDLERPDQLIRLLTTMARNKLASEARRQYRQRRDIRRSPAGPEVWAEFRSAEPSPSRVLSGKERLEQLLAHLDERARRLAELRAAGQSWAEIAGRLGGAPQALRMQLARAVERAARESGVEGV
jgi:RNA polymerase sigma-70 factor (ECF subfamily)